MFRRLVGFGFWVFLVATPVNAQQWFAEEGQGVRSAGIEYGLTVLSVSCAITAANVPDTISVNFNNVRPDGPVSFHFSSGTLISVPFSQGWMSVVSAETHGIYGETLRLMMSSEKVTVSDPSSGSRQTFSLQGAGQALAPCQIRYTGSTQAEARETILLKLESYLFKLGYDPGIVDGEVDINTQTAISAYQADRGLPATGGMEMAGFKALEKEALAKAN